MTKRKYTEEEQKIFNYERFNHPHPRVQLKMEVLFLKSKKLSNKEIASLANISENTVRNYEYEDGGIEKLKEVNFYKPESELSKYQETIEEYFETNPPTTIKEAVAKDDFKNNKEVLTDN